MSVQLQAATPMAVAATPVTVKERMAIVDILRGFALFGVSLH